MKALMKFFLLAPPRTKYLRGSLFIGVVLEFD